MVDLRWKRTPHIDINLPVTGLGHSIAEHAKLAQIAQDYLWSQTYILIEIRAKVAQIATAYLTALHTQKRSVIACDAVTVNHVMKMTPCSLGKPLYRSRNYRFIVHFFHICDKNSENLGYMCCN